MASKAKTGGDAPGAYRIKRPKPAPLALEPRFVFDAAAVIEVVQAADRAAPDVVDRALAKFVESASQRQATAEQTADAVAGDPQAAGPEADHGADQSWPAERPVEKLSLERATTLYIVDSRVPDLESIAANLPAGAYLLLDPAQDGVRQVSDFLAGRRDVATLTFITDGAPGEIRLGSTELSTWNLDAYAQDLRGWMAALGPDADILLLGCEVAQGDTGELFIQRFAALTGADVGASTDLTGAAAKGGDLVLEAAVGAVDDTSLRSVDALASYADVLTFSAGAAFTVTGDADNLILPAERTTNLVINVPSGTINNAQSTGADLLVAISSGTELIAWQVSQPGITNGNGTGAALTVNVPVSLLGAFQGPIKIDLFQGTRVGGGTATTASAAWTSSRGSIALPDFNNQSTSTTATSLVTSSTAPGATKSVGYVADATNSAPVATVPGSPITVSGATAISGVSVSDADAGYAPITVTLTAPNGTMSVRTDVSGGLTSSGVTNNGTGAVTLTGSQYAINATLAATNGLQFTRSGNFSGSTTITVGVNDGNSGLQGTGGALTDSETINLNVASAGPTLANDTASVTEDVTTSASGNLLTNDTSNGGTLSVTQVRIGTSGSFGVIGSALTGSYGSLTLNADGSYSYALDNAAPAVQGLAAGATLTDVFTYTASNGTSTATATLTVTITGTNDAPVLDATKSPVLTSVAQTAGAPVGAVGTLVSALLTGSVTDVDSSSPGVAVTALDQSSGTWHLSTNGGTSWSQLSAATISALSSSNALLLDPTARLYFRPNGSFAGTLASAVTFRAWDRATGTAGTSVDTTSNGSSTAYSSAIDTAAITVRPAYSLASPDSAFATLLVGNRFDPSSDTQANSSDLDLYGQNSVPLLYGAYDANSNDLYFRLRIDNPTLSKGVPVFSAVVLLGVDATGDGRIDMFLAVDGRNNGLGVVSYDPGSDLNISPSTTSITNQRSFSSVSTSSPATTGFYTYALAGNDLGGDGKQDAALTFRVPFAMLESRLETLLAAKGISYNLTPGSTVSYVLLTLTQNNSINGDIGGVGKLTTAQKNITYSDLGVLQPVSFAAPSLTNVSGSVSYTENGAAVRLAPSATLTDLDSATYGTGKIAVTLTGAQTGDTLSFAAIGGITTSGSNLLHNGVVVGTISTSTGSLTVDFNGSASKMAVEAALQALSFSSTSDNPGATSRTASFVVTDPEANSSTARTVTVFVTPVNDAPTVASTPASRTVTNGQTYTIASAALSNALLLQAGQSSNASIADLDAGTANVTATLSVPIGVIQVYNNSSLVSGTSATTFGGVSVTGSGTGSIVLSGTVAAINSFLAGNTGAQLLYQAGSSAADGTQVTVTLAVNDLGNSGSGGSLTGSATYSTITIAGAPVLAGAFSGNVREDNNVQGGNLLATGSITANGAPLAGATVSFLGNTAGSSQLGTLTYDSGTGAWTYSVANSTSAIQLLAAGGRIEESFAIETTINGTPVAGFIRVAIDGVNDAPTLTVTAVSPTFTELASPSMPTPVDIFDAPSLSTFEANQLIDRITLTVGSISDGETEFVRVDGSYIQLLAGTTTTATNGYAVTVVRDGTTATLTIDMSGGIGTDAAATLLDGLAYLNTAEIATASMRVVTVTSVRDTGGTANGGQDSSTPNLSSTITLQPLNDGPVLNTGLASLPAGRSFLLTAAHLLASDPDNAAEQLTYTLTSTPQFGVLQYSADGATNWTTINANGATFTQADVAAGRVRYVANSGVANGSVDNLGFTVSDGALSGSGIFSITISNANNAPIAFDSLATTLEDSTYVFALTDFLTSDGDDGDSVSAIQITTTESAGALEYNDGGTWTAVTAGQIVTASDITAGKLRFVPVANANGRGYATFEFKAYDSQNAISADSAIFTVDVASVNDAPAGADKTITVNEDATYTFAAGDFGFTDGTDSPANGLASIVITSLPAAGTLKLNGVDVQVNDVVAVASFGQLTFTPAPNASGTAYATIGFKVRDDGGTAGGGVDTDPIANTITFNVTAVNDAPTLAAVSRTLTDTAADDSFATLTGTLAGADVENSTLTYGIDQGTDGGATVSLVGSYGTLTVDKTTGAYSYVPSDAAIEARKTDASDSFTITVSDGTATTTSTFTLNITGANDTPTLAASVTSATLADSAVPDSFADVVGTLTGTDRDSPETLGYALTGSTAEANTVGGVAYTHRLTGGYGTLYFNDTTRAYRFVADAAAIDALAAGQSAAPTYSFVLTDGSGATDSETLTINISGANDAPIASDDSVTTAEDTAATFDVRTNDSDVDGGTLAVTQVAGQAISVGSPVAITGGSVSLNADGTLTFTPAANFNGSTSFAYTISDGQGGNATATVSLTVTAVNDAPTLGSTSRTITDTAADDTYATLTGSLAGGDVDAGTTLSYGIQGGTDNGTTVSRVGTYGTLTVTKATGAYSYVPVDAAVEATKTGVSDMFTITVGDGTATTPAPFTVDIAGANDTPQLDHAIADQSGSIGSAFSFAFAANTFSDRDNDTLSYSATLAGGAALPAWLSFDSETRSFSGTPPMGSAGNYDITVTASDGAATASDTFRLSIAADAAAPANTVPGAQTVTEDTALAISGISVADVDDDLATTRVSVTNGTLTVSLAGGATVSAGANGSASLSLSGSQAEINAALATLSYLGNANFHGSDTLTVLSTDADNNIDSDTVAITVTPVNDMPAGADKTITLTEDGSHAFAASDFGFSDPNDSPANALAAVVITTVPTNGTLKLNGVDVVAGALIAVADLGQLVFAPAANANGTGYASFTFQVRDDGGTASGGADTDATPNTISFDVTAVNDAPVITSNGGGANASASVPENSTAVTTVTATDIDSATVSYSIVGGADQARFVIDATTGALSFVAAPDFEGPTDADTDNVYIVQVQVSDSAGGTTLQTISVTVTNVNEAPSSTNDSATTLEDTAITLRSGDFGSFSDPDAGASLASVRITALPTAGTLEYDNGSAWVAVTLNQDINAADLAAGRLRFVPAANANGSAYATLGFQVSDGALLSGTQTLTVDVTPVNDIPAGADKTITLSEDGSHAFVASDFGFSDASDSPANSLAAVVITTLPTAGTLKLGGVDVQTGDAIAVADLGQLVFAPAANANGTAYASFTFQVRDDGGTANGGVNTDTTPNTITFDVAAVNDAPVITSNGGGANASTSAPENSTAVTTVTATDVDSATLSYSIVGGGDQARFTIDATTGALSFVAAPNFEAPTDTDSDNVYVVQVQASDGAGGAVTQTISVTVTNVNEAPSSTNDSVITAEDTAVVLSASDFGTFADPDAGASFGGVRITSLPAAGTLEYDEGSAWVAVTAGQDISAADIAAGRLRFVPAPGASGTGYATIGFRVSDGSLLSTAAYALSVDVTAVNDAPVLTVPAAIARTDTAADDSFAPATGTLVATDADAGDTRTFAIGGSGTAAPGGPTFTLDGITYDRSRVGTYGTLYLDSASGAYRYEPNDAAIEALTANAGESFELVVTDDANASDSRTLSIALTGVNDTAAITGIATGTVAEDGTLTAGGTLAVADRDAGQSTFQAPGSLAGSYGTFTFNVATGGWGYTLDNSHAAVQALRLGQSLTDTLGVASSDGTAAQTITVTINGANDAPTLGTPAAINLVDTPANDNLTPMTGTLSSGDADNGDSRSFAITGTGVTAGSFSFDGDAVTYDQSLAGTYGTLYLNGMSGAYRFVPNAAAVNGVAAGATPAESFGLQVTDGAGAMAATTLQVNVTGANDTPSIVGATNPAPVAEAANAEAQDIAATTGSFSVADRDIGDTLTASVTGSAVAALNGGALPGGVDVSALVAAGAISFGATQTSDGGTRVFTWTYDPAAVNLDWLKPGDALTITYTARVDDGTGPVGSQPLVITITGTNDAPVLTAPAAISLADTGATDSLAATLGTLASADVDSGDTRSFTVGAATTAGGPWVFDGVSYDQTRTGTYGTLFVDSATGAYRFAPNNAAVNALSGGQSANDSFDLTVTDGAGASDAETLTVTVTGANDPAVIGGATTGAVVEAGGMANAVTGTPTAGGTLTVADVDSATTFVPQTSVAAGYGSFTLAANGAWSYLLSNAAAAVEALNAGQTLTDIVTVTTADGTTATVTLTISGANDAPVATAIANRGAQLNTPFSYQVPAFADVDNATLSYGASRADGSPLPAWLNFDAATRTFTGTPAVADLGDLLLRVTASDGSLTASSDFTISVGNTTPVAAADTGTAGENEIKTFTALPNDSDADPGDVLTLQSLGTAMVASANPSVNGISLAGALTIVGGEVRFDPGTRFDALAAGETATVTVPYTIADSAGATATASLTITVTGSNDAPVASNDSVATAEDTAITFDVRTNDSDVDGGALTVTAINETPISVGSPVTTTGGSVSLNADGTLTFTPSANFNGTPSFTYTVSDGEGGTATATVDLTVTPANDAPVAQPGTGTGPEGSAITGTVTATDLDGDGLSYALVASPPAGQGALTFNADGSYRFVPATDFNGIVTFTYKANDGTADSNVATVTLTVTPLNDAPTARADTIVTAEDTPVTFDVRSNDGDVDGDSLAVTQVDGRAISLGNPVPVTGGSVSLNANGTLTFTPAVNFNGNPSFSYTVSDGKGGIATATVNLAVTPVNDDPSAVSLTLVGGGTQLSVLENVAGAAIGPVTALDPDLGDAIALSVDDARFEIVDGQLRLRPGTALDFEATRSVTIAITATDAAGRTRTASFTINVLDVNEASVAQGDDYAVDGGRTLTVPAGTGVLANDNDPEGGPLTAELVSGPANGTLTLNADGSFAYTPNAGFAGTDSFVYRAQDGSPTPGTATVSISVRTVPVPPVVLPPPVDVPPPPAPPPVVAPDVGAGPSAPAPGFSVPVEAAQSPTGAPLAAVEAVDSLVSRISVGSAFTDPGGYQVTVLPGGGDNLVLFRGVPDQQFEGASLVRFTVPVDAFAHTRTDQTVTLVATLIDGRPLPGWLTFSSARGLFEGVPPPNTNGEIAIRVIARDNEGREAAAVFRVKINAAGATESAVDGKTSPGEKTAKRQPPQLLRDSRAANDIRERAAKLVRSG